MKRHTTLAFLGGLLGLLLSGCGGAAPASTSGSGGLTGTLQLSGSSTLAPLASEIGRRFEGLHPAVRVEVQTGGSSRGIADAGSGLADIGMSSRPLKATEQDGRVSWTVAMDGVAFIVHAANEVPELSRQQLIDIYTGRLDSWREVGGADAEIQVIHRAAGRSEVELLSDFLTLAEADIRPDLIAGENQQAVKMVANDRHAITYLSVGAAEHEVARGTPIKLLPLGGVTATAAEVAAGRFPLARPLVFVTQTQPPTLAQAFIDYARSSEVHDLVTELSYVPLESGS